MHDSRSGTLRAYAALAMIMLITSACGERDEPNEDPPEIGSIPTVTSPAQISLPLDAYNMTAEEDLTLQRAEWQLAVACMADFGVDYTPPSPLYPAVTGTNHERLYGIFDLESAKAWGYHGGDPAVMREAQEAQVVADRDQQESEAVSELLAGPSDPNASPPAGVPEGGCLGAARQELAGNEESIDESLIANLAAEANARAEQDGRVRAAFDNWSGCMANEGFEYATPWESNNDRWEAPNDEVTAREIAVATADVTCKRETNLVGVWSAVDAAYQGRLIEENAQHLSELTRARNLRLERAAALSRGELDAQANTLSKMTVQ